MSALRSLTYLLLLSCSTLEMQNEAAVTSFVNDTAKMRLDQLLVLPNNEFIGLYFDENSSLSGNRRIRLYTPDSLCIDQLSFGAHPMTIISHTDSTVTIEVSVYSAHGDSVYRSWYLDNSVDGKTPLGPYEIHYVKDYDLNWGKQSITD